MKFNSWKLTLHYCFVELSGLEGLAGFFVDLEQQTHAFELKVDRGAAVSVGDDVAVVVFFYLLVALVELVVELGESRVVAQLGQALLEGFAQVC